MEPATTIQRVNQLANPNLKEAALKLNKEGYSIIPAKIDKTPRINSWKEFQKKIASPNELSEQFNNSGIASIAIITGSISGGLEVIDIDLKYDISGRLYKRLQESLEENLPEILRKLRIVKTISGGYHWYYKCEVIERSKKLAQRFTTDQEKIKDPNDKIKVLIETRGEGGYVIAPPSPGYTYIQGNEPPILSIDQRDTLLSILRSFNEVYADPIPIPIEKVLSDDITIAPWDDYNKRGDIKELLIAHGWEPVNYYNGWENFKRPGTENKLSAGFNKELNLFHSFSTSTPFDTSRGYKPAAVFAILECNGDFKQAAKKLIDLGYGKRNNEQPMKSVIQKLKKQGLSGPDLIRELVYSQKITEAEAIENIQLTEKLAGPTIKKFWSIDDKHKIVLCRTDLIKFLVERGFYQFQINPKVLQLIRVDNGLIEEATVEEIKKSVVEYIENLPEYFDNGITPKDLMEIVLRGADSFFNKGSLDFLPRLTPNFLKDGPETAYFPFLNGVVEVTKDAYKIKSHKEINKHIWKSQVINSKIELLDDKDEGEIEYLTFLECISNGEQERYFYAFSLIGYLLHNYKHPANSFAVILAEETDNEDQGGGTGKGIFVKALQKMIPIATIDGKNFKADKNFLFQRVSQDTRCVFIDDTKKDFDFEALYSIITEGITIEKKNKDEIFIPYEDSPKLILSTNYSISNIGNHAKRRQRVLEFAPKFNAKYTPQDHFKHQLFNDWDPAEWNRFYNLMFYCVKTFLKEGIMGVENSEKIKRKQIRTSFSGEFLEWWEDYLKEHKGKWKLFCELFNDFLNTNEFDKKDYSQRRFKKAFENSTHIMGLGLERQISRQNNNKPEYRVVDVVDV